MSNENVEEITCHKCERVWPLISEQGVVTELYEKCYACLVAEVIEIRDARATAADYIIEGCDECGGLDPDRQSCIVCSQNGWQAFPKKASDIIELIH